MKETQTQPQSIYDSPRVKVVEIKARKVLCGSPTSTERDSSDMGGGEDMNF